jgi:tetratricopeptide (TPR) repeat protein
MAVAPLQSIGPYRVLRAIARGGTAEVYEVEDRLSGEHLALKLLVQPAPTAQGARASALLRFNREYEAMIRLNHPNIVRVYHYGFHEGKPWLTMELLDGTPVQAYAKSAGRPGDEARLREVLRIGHDIARALDHIHRRGLLHRDVKSANVLVLPDGRVKLLDFGTARVADGAAVITREGEFLGTFAYASPEQCTGKALDQRSDLYSLGVLLYRLFTGVLPFLGPDKNELVRQHLRMKPVPLRQLVPSLPEAVEQIVLSMLEKDRGWRPDSGAAVAGRFADAAERPLLLPGTLDVGGAPERLIGREEQMGKAWAFLDAATPGSMVLVVGQPGSGREQVMRAIENELSRRQWRMITCDLDDGSDLGGLDEILLDVGEPLGVEQAPHLRHTLQGFKRALSTPNLQPPRRREVVRTVAHMVFTERAKLDARPMVLRLRRLHRASESFLDLLKSLRDGAARQGIPVLFVGDCDETAEDPGAAVRSRIPNALRVLLPPLTYPQVALLVGALLHRRPPPAAVARRIHAASGGMPAYVEDVVKTMVEQGLLRVQGRDANRLEWARREISVPVPMAARRELLEVLSALPADRRRVLEALAAVGASGSDAVLAVALDRLEEEIRPALTDLRARGLVAWEGERQVTVRWRQRLAEAVVLEHVNPCRIHLMRRRLLGALANAPVSVSQVRLLVGTGQVEEATARALAWAERFVAADQPVTALEVLDLVVDRAAESSHRVDLGRLFLLHAICLLMVRPTDAQTGGSLARAAAHGSGGAFQAELELTRASLQRVIGHYRNYRTHLMVAWNHIEREPPPRLASAIAVNLGTSLHMAGLLDEAGDWYQRAQFFAARGKDPSDARGAGVGMGAWLNSRGLVRDADRALTGVVQQCVKERDAGVLTRALPPWTDVLRQQGRLSEALSSLDRSLPSLRLGEVVSSYVALLVATAWCELDLCRLGRAQECVDELFGMLRHGEHLHLRLEADLVYGRILLLSGNLREAVTVLHTVMERGRTAELVLLAEHARALMAESLWGLGKVPEAEAHFRGACQRLEAAGDVPTLVQACLSRARVLSTTVDPGNLFAPIGHYLETEPAHVARLEWRLAQGRYLRAVQQDPKPAYQKAREGLDRIAKRLNDTDQAALRVHPWSREIRAGGIE